LFKDVKEARSRVIRDQVWQWLSGVAMNRLMSDKANVIIVGTRWDEDDHFGRLTDKQNAYYSRKMAKLWKDVNIPAIAGHDDPMGRKPGEALWPERFSHEFLAEQKALNPVAFSALYQGKPTPDSGVIFKPEYFHTYKRHQLPHGLRIYVGSDHAVSTTADADKTCIVIVGVDESSTIWIIDAIWDKLPSDRAIDMMINVMQQHKPLMWWAERGQISKSIGPILRKCMMERGVFCAIQEVTPAGDKAMRAAPIAGRMAMGKVLWPEEKRWYIDARSQFMRFTGDAGGKDDFVDALAYLGMGLQFLLPARSESAREESTTKPFTGRWLKEQDKQQARARRRFSMSGARI
jgi:predicted phage terminase large subunit-like protein